MENEPTLWEKRKEDRDTYKLGVKEGFNQGLWVAIGLAGGLYFLFSILPS